MLRLRIGNQLLSVGLTAASPRPVCRVNSAKLFVEGHFPFRTVDAFMCTVFIGVADPIMGA